MRRGKRGLIGLSAVFAVIIAALTVWGISSRSSANRLPTTDPSAVAEIAAELDGKYDRFTVDSVDFGAVLGLFDDGSPVGIPLPWQVAGNVWITYRDGRTYSIALFRTGEASGAYRVGRQQYRGSNDATIEAVITECALRAFIRRVQT